MASKQATAVKVGDLDLDKLNVGQKATYKNAPGNYLPVKYGNSENKYQVRGLYITFAGHKKELKESEKADPTTIAYWINIDITKKECRYLPGGKNDAEAFYKYNKSLDAKILERLGKRYKLGKQDSDEFNSYYSLISEGQKKKDSNEYYNDSIKLPLTMAKGPDGKTKILKFETKFINAETKEVLNITPENISKIIRPSSYCIAIINDSRVWLGTGIAKLTRKIVEMKLVLADDSQNVSDDFIDTGNATNSNASPQQVTEHLTKLLPSVATPDNASSVSSVSNDPDASKQNKKAKSTSKSTEDTQEDAQEDADLDIEPPPKAKSKGKK